MSVLWHKIIGLIRTCERVFLVSVFLTMIVMFTFSVVIREFGGSLASDFAWIEEAVKILNLFLVFVALGSALEKGRHVSISTIRDFIGPVSALWLRRLTDLIGLCFAVYLAVLSSDLVAFVAKTGQVSPTLGIAMSWVYVAPMTGFILLALRYFMSLVGLIDRYADEPSSDTNSAERGENA